jgi:hypothetical protein
MREASIRARRRLARRDGLCSYGSAIPARDSHTPATSTIPIATVTARNSTGWPSALVCAALADGLPPPSQRPILSYYRATAVRSGLGRAPGRFVVGAERCKRGIAHRVLVAGPSALDVALQLRARRPFVVQRRRGHRLHGRGGRKLARAGAGNDDPPFALCEL